MPPLPPTKAAAEVVERLRVLAINLLRLVQPFVFCWGFEGLGVLGRLLLAQQVGIPCFWVLQHCLQREVVVALEELPQVLREVPRAAVLAP